jgi:hypothetical protein
VLGLFVACFFLRGIFAVVSLIFKVIFGTFWMLGVFAAKAAAVLAVVFLIYLVYEVVSAGYGSLRGKL